MLSLFRNPLLRLLGRVWWLPTLVLVTASRVGGEAGILFTEATLLFFLGILVSAWVHGLAVAGLARSRHRSSQHSFLCPHCLQFGDFEFACGACGNSLPSFLVYTGGVYCNECPDCHVSLFSRGTHDGKGVSAYCGQCKGACDRALYHERQVMMRAALLSADFEALSRSAGVPGTKVNSIGCACVDDGTQLNYVLNLNDLTDTSQNLPSAHGLRAVEAIWLDTLGVKPLLLAKAVDGFLLQTRRAEIQTTGFSVCIRQPKNALDPASLNLLEARFETIRYGELATHFLPGKAAETASKRLPGLESQ